MNIHLPAILMFTRGTRVLTHCHMTEAKLNGHCSSPSLIAPPSCHRQAEPETGTTKVQTENLPPFIALVGRCLGKWRVNLSVNPKIRSCFDVPCFLIFWWPWFWTSKRHGQATHVDQAMSPAIHFTVMQSMSSKKVADIGAPPGLPVRRHGVRMLGTDWKGDRRGSSWGVEPRSLWRCFFSWFFRRQVRRLSVSTEEIGRVMYGNVIYWYLLHSGKSNVIRIQWLFWFARGE